LNCNNTGRILIWDLGGDDTLQQPIFAVVPSHDVQPTRSQIDRIKSNSGADKPHDHNPHISAMLATGLSLSAYTLPSGPACYGYGRDAWSRLWALLNSFTLLKPMYHPASAVRRPEQYRQTLLDANLRFVRQFEANDQPRVLSEEELHAASVGRDERDDDDDDEDWVNN
jgi:hypothetical protein